MHNLLNKVLEKSIKISTSPTTPHLDTPEMHPIPDNLVILLLHQLLQLLNPVPKPPPNNPHKSPILVPQGAHLLLHTPHLLHQNSHIVAEFANFGQEAIMAIGQRRGNIEHLQDLTVIGHRLG